MKYRVKAFIGQRTWWWDYPATAEGNKAAEAKVSALRVFGLRERSKAGVLTIYPPHRIHKIVCRTIRAS